MLLVVTGAIGVLLSVSGAGLWLAAFSNTFLETNPDPAWQEAEAAGTFLFVCGAVLFVTSIVAGLVVGIRSLTRGAHRG